MAEGLHSQAPHHLPPFIPGPDGSDPLFTFIVVFLVIVAVLLGAAYFTLHALPEKMAHKANSTQLQVIGVLALLAMFTHNNLFWIIALLLAAIRFPDFTTPLNAIADSLGELKDRGLQGLAQRAPPESKQSAPPESEQPAPPESEQPAPRSEVAQDPREIDQPGQRESGEEEWLELDKHDPQKLKGEES